MGKEFITNTVLTGSNFPQNDSQEGVIVLAGTNLFLPKTKYNCSRLGIGIRFGSSLKHRVTIRPQSVNNASDIGTAKTIIENGSTASDRGLSSIQLDSASGILTIQNLDTVDATITVLSVSEFN